MPDAAIGPTDQLLLHVVRAHPHVPDSIKARLATWQAQSRLSQAVLACLPHLPHEEIAHELLDRILASAVIESALHLVVRRGDGRHEDHGIVDRRVVTTAGVTYLCAAGKSIYDFNYHGLGSGSTAPAITDTALVTEFPSGDFSTGYRPAGTQSNTAVSGNEKYTSVATNTASAAITVAEIGQFSAVTAGTLWDRFVPAGTTALAIGDSLQTTIATTLNSGG